MEEKKEEVEKENYAQEEAGPSTSTDVRKNWLLQGGREKSFRFLSQHMQIS